VLLSFLAKPGVRACLAWPGLLGRADAPARSAARRSWLPCLPSWRGLV
jgi:hypothetical protein